MKKRFSKINIEISNLCNLQCSFCPEVIRPSRQMDLALFEKIIKEVGPLTDQVCLHLMGEPLLHPRFEQFIKICETYQVPVFLVSNGVLLKEKNYQTLLNPTIRQVNFSMHSFADNFKDKDPTAYVENIFNWTELAFAQRPDLYINYRLWNLQNPMSQKNENQIMMKMIEQKFQKTFNQRIDIRSYKSVHIINRLYLHYDTEFIWPDVQLPHLGDKGTCYGLKSHFGILADGTVVPCCLDKEGVIPLGNVENSPILDILNSERSLKILNGFKNNKLEERLCQSCNYIERFR